MKKLILLTVLFTFILSGCSMFGLTGAVYTNVTTPITATNNEKGPKTGKAKCLSVLGIAATGDCSIDTAAKNGNITEVKSVDVKTFSVLGLFNEQTTIVTGN